MNFMKRGFGRLIIPVRLLCLIILVASGLPRIVHAAPVINESFATPLSATPVPITSDDLFSTADVTTLVDPPVTSTQHFGPYTSTSPDSGTCGNDWATDTFDRHFTVFPGSGGSVSSIVEQFKDGSFVTPAPVDDPDRTPNGPSPGACQPENPPGGTVNDGITGEMHGFFIISVPPGTVETSNDPHCDALTKTNDNCDTRTFVNTHFDCIYQVTCTVTTFFFHFTAEDQGLVMTEWKNASTDKGGNQGDIRSGPVACPPGDEDDSNQQQDQELCED